MDDEQPPKRFLTLADVAQELQVTPFLIRGLIRSGELPAIQVGGRGQGRIERDKRGAYIAGAYEQTRSAIQDGSNHQDE